MNEKDLELFNVCLYKGFCNGLQAEVIDSEVKGFESAVKGAEYYHSLDGKCYVVTDTGTTEILYKTKVTITTFEVELTRHQIKSLLQYEPECKWQSLLENAAMQDSEPITNEIEEADAMQATELSVNHWQGRIGQLWGIKYTAIETRNGDYLEYNSSCELDKDLIAMFKEELFI